MANVKKLSLINYRNHKSLDLTFGENINLIVGGNALGKTNILEAIYFLGRGKSFRSIDLKDLISWDGGACRVEALISRDRGLSTGVAYLDADNRQFKLDGKNKRAGLDFGVVLFVPHDITIFRDTPSARRTYLNDLILGIDDAYKRVIGVST